jgi:hypothetical protein
MGSDQHYEGGLQPRLLPADLTPFFTVGGKNY